jgi:hypothetical protein
MDKFFNLLGKFFLFVIVFYGVIYVIDFAYRGYQINRIKTTISNSYSNSNTQTYKSRDEVKKSDFILYDVQGRWINGRFRVLGDVKNIGSIPAGVQIEVKALDRYGKTIDSKKYFPNGSDNLDPNDSVGIERNLTKDKSAVDVVAKVVSTIVW